MESETPHPRVNPTDTRIDPLPACSDRAPSDTVPRLVPGLDRAHARCPYTQGYLSPRAATTMLRSVCGLSLALQRPLAVLLLGIR